MEEHIKDRLVARAYLYADPESYRAGVLAALAVAEAQQSQADTQHPQHEPTLVFDGVPLEGAGRHS